MTSAIDLEYTDDLVERLELLWGDGFLSPGGSEEVAKLLEGIEVGDFCFCKRDDHFAAAHERNVEIGTELFEDLCACDVVPGLV